MGTGASLVLPSGQPVEAAGVAVAGVAAVEVPAVSADSVAVASAVEDPVEAGSHRQQPGIIQSYFIQWSC